MKTRKDAWALVTEFTASPNLINHMLAVEAAMRAYAQHFGEDEALWGIVGLLHDFDYERYPDLTVEGHPVVGSKILRERGWSEEIIRAVLSHADYTGVTRETRMEKTLAAVDDLTGFVTAVALVRPSKSIHDVKVKSIRKKWKSKALLRPSTARRLRRRLRIWASSCGPTWHLCYRRCKASPMSWACKVSLFEPCLGKG